MTIIIMADDDLIGKAALFSQGRLFFCFAPVPLRSDEPWHGYADIPVPGFCQTFSGLEVPPLAIVLSERRFCL
jgi:hypothetical protein